MKKALSIIMFTLFSIIYAQELGKEVSVTKNWISVIDTYNNELKLSNGSISNRTNKATKDLSLDFYLSENPVDFSNLGVYGTLITKNPINSINRNSSISGITLQNTIKKLPADGTYYQILVLTEKNGDIKDIVQLSSKVFIENGKLITKNEKIAPVEKTNNPSRTDMSGVTDITKPIKLKVVTDNKIILDKEWKINIDYKEFMVQLTGGKIRNNSSEKTNNLIIDVYLVKNNMSSINANFDGIHIGKIPLESMEGKETISKAVLKTNLRAIPPQGTYYIMLTVSETDNAGNAVVRSTKLFKNAITL